MIKFKKLAVIICGDYRTWPRASEYMFAYFEQLSDSVDYYFATWSTTRDYWWPEHKSIKTMRSVTDFDITKYFKNRNLVDYCIVEQSAIPVQKYSFYYQSYLALLANKLKVKKEINDNFIYDQVFEARPDLYIRLVDGEIYSCNDGEYCIGETWVDVDFNIPGQHIGDLLMRSSSKTYNCIANRYYYLNEHSQPRDLGNTSNHVLLYNYLQTVQLKPSSGCNLCECIPIRPNFPDNNLHLYKFTELRRLDRQWVDQQWL